MLSLAPSRDCLLVLTSRIWDAFQELKSEIKSSTTLLQDHLQQIFLAEIKESKSGIEFLNRTLELQVGSLTTRVTSLLADLLHRTGQLAQALDVSAALEPARRQCLSMVQDSGPSLEGLTTILKDREGLSPAAPDLAPEPHSAANGEAVPCGNQRVVVGCGSLQFDHLTFDAPVAAHSGHGSAHSRHEPGAFTDEETSGSRSRSNLLVRLSNQLGHLYKEATTPDYEKAKPEKDEGLQVVHVGNRSRTLTSIKLDYREFGGTKWIHQWHALLLERNPDSGSASELIEKFSEGKLLFLPSEFWYICRLCAT
jgi:hypothetical protein